MFIYSRCVTSLPFAGNATCLVRVMRELRSEEISTVEKSEIIPFPLSSEHWSDFPCVETEQKATEREKVKVSFWATFGNAINRSFVVNVYLNFAFRQMFDVASFAVKSFRQQNFHFGFSGPLRAYWLLVDVIDEFVKQKQSICARLRPKLDLIFFRRWRRNANLPALKWAEAFNNLNLENHSIPSLACKLVRKFSNFLFFSRLFSFFKLKLEHSQPTANQIDSLRCNEIRIQLKSISIMFVCNRAD